MKRLMAFAVVALMTVGATGCATGVEDPQPPPPTPTKSNPAPVTTFSDELDTSEPDPAQIGNGGLDAPKPDLEKFEMPVPTNGAPIDPYREADDFRLPDQLIPVTE